MADDASANKGVLAKVLGTVFLIIVSYFLALFFSILIEWLGIYFEWWEEDGAGHAKAVLKAEYGWLHSDYQGGFFQPTNLSNVMMNFFNDEVIQTPEFSKMVQVIGADHAVIDYLYAMVFVIQTALLRLTVIIMSMPALLLFVIFALIDGFCERDVRAWSGGRETSFVYHHAKSFVVPFMILPVVLYLSVPVSIHPSIFMLVFALPASLMVWLLAKYFKKYL